MSSKNKAFFIHCFCLTLFNCLFNLSLTLAIKTILLQSQKKQQNERNHNISDKLLVHLVWKQSHFLVEKQLHPFHQ